jgi:hypothetical protein
MKATQHKIGLPCTPSKHVSQEIKKGTKIVISFGGGLGGANRTIYAKTVKEVKKFGIPMLEIVPFFGEQEELNPQFIVATQDCQIVKDVTDTTMHSNSSKTTCSFSTSTRYFVIGAADTVFKSNEYGGILKHIKEEIVRG